MGAKPKGIKFVTLHLMALFNRVDKRVLKERIASDTRPRRTLSFYRYVVFEDPAALRDVLYRRWESLEVLGRIYVAREGINAQLSVPEDRYSDFVADLNSIPGLEQIPLKFAVEDNGKSFYKLIVRVRPKIVADGLDDDAYDVTNVGKHLTAREFNDAMELPDTLVVDMRNHYESEVGHFEGAILPDSDTFREELPLVEELLKGSEEKKILLYCTGGIRCEKASAYLKHKGFKDVNQLHGGIIDYVRQVKSEGLNNKFLGKNFVFDERLGERISGEVISVCHQCGSTSDLHTNCANNDCHLLFIQCEACREAMLGCCSENCREIFLLPEEVQRSMRKGNKKSDTHAVNRNRLRPRPGQITIRRKP